MSETNAPTFGRYLSVCNTNISTVVYPSNEIWLCGKHPSDETKGTGLYRVYERASSDSLRQLP